MNKYPNLIVTSKLEQSYKPGSTSNGLQLYGTILAITGHRPNKLGNDYEYTSPLMNKLASRLSTEISKIKPDYMISGVALGVDTIFAQLSFVHKIPLIAAIPFTDQDILWPNRSRSLYHHILGLATIIVNVSGQASYHKTYMWLRNQWVVDHCTKLIGVWDGSSGGTASCLKYANSVMKQEDITIINPTTL